MRKTMIQAILYTDMALHFELLAKLNAHLSTNDFSRDVPDDRQLLVSAMLHSADLSNVAKPSFDVCRKWSDMVLNEFLNQVSRLELKY